MNDPTGRLGSLSPERARRMASEIALIASSCPIIRSCRRSSIWSNFWVSDSNSCVTGIPVHWLITSAISSASTTSSSLFSASQADCLWLKVSSSFSRSDFSLTASSYSRSRLAFSSSANNRSISLRSCLRSSGREYKATRSFAAASSIKSIALSGNLRPVIYLAERFAAASSASSESLTL